MGAATAVTEHDIADRRGRREQLRAWLLAPGIPMVLAALFSMPRLGSRSMWLDEAYTVGATNQLVDTWQETGGTQALYYLMVWPFSRVSIEPAWMRLPSALLAVVAVALIYEVGRRIGGRTMAVLSSGGLALSWGFARYAVEARGYMLSLVLVSLSWLALIAIVSEASSSASAAPDARSGRVSRRWWTVFAVATLLAPLAHGLAVLHFPVQAAALVLAPLPRRWVRIFAGVGVGLAIQLGGLALLGASDIGDWVDPLNLNQVRNMAWLMSGPGITGELLFLGMATAAFQAVRTYLGTKDADTWVRLVPVFWALGAPALVLAISVVRPYAASRYIFAALPGFILLLAALLASLSSRRVVAIGVTAVVAAMLVSDQWRVTTNGIEDWEGMTACMVANAVEGDRLMTGAAHRSPIDYYWPEDGPEVPIEPLYPPDQLGPVKRLYETTEPSLKELLLADTSEPVWHVARGQFGEAIIASFAFDEEISSHYVLADAMSFKGGISLVRLDPIQDAGLRSPVSCDQAKPMD